MAKRKGSKAPANRQPKPAPSEQRSAAADNATKQPAREAPKLPANGPSFRQIKADKVTCTAGDVTMLPPTSLTVKPGENIAIVGSNGAGKTTFLRVLTGNLQPTSGSVTMDDLPIDERDAGTRRVIAPLIGPVAGYRDLTVADHLILIDQTWGGDRDGAGERIAAVLNRLDILRFGNRYLAELSSGQRQLVELAMVLLRPSALLVLDEPEQRLDEDRRALLGDVLRERADAGSSVVWVCHDRELADRTATRIVRFPQGS
ncbi:ABC transporter ATP-binding protein [Flexivirga caeni]|uniref:ABC transporter ATP-binding protein n=1 Tax=Flexivirga caeni TaxID=2294115 RepID=A0A3M9M0E0_9MICO|nr:ABC transporter ATP-binding protein [Flexivirga caeni]RNI19029.1 ABC transporter ATP-binding protein [Flexivirga caeni]